MKHVLLTFGLLLCLGLSGCAMVQINGVSTAFSSGADVD